MASTTRSRVTQDHRRPRGDFGRDHRVVGIDELHFDDRGFITPVRIPHEGVCADPTLRTRR